jgi:hypothetical protein
LLLLGFQLFGAFCQVSAFSWENFGPGFCSIRKCPLILGTCFGDSRCRQWLWCVAQCSMTDTHCQIECLFTQPDHNKPIQQLMKCLLQRSCLSNSTPSRQCPRPKSVGSGVGDFDLKMLEGRWHVLFGLSVDYDCWPCQEMRFRSVVDRQINFQSSSDIHRTSLNYNYSMIVHGYEHNIPCTAERTSLPHQIDVHYLISDVIPGRDEWHVVDLSPDRRFLLIYYWYGSDIFNAQFCINCSHN